MAMEEAGVEVPNDISIVGVDDLPFSFLVRPALTSIRVPREELGRTAFAALDKLLKLKRQKGNEYVVTTELVVRKSTGPEPRFAKRKPALGTGGDCRE